MAVINGTPGPDVDLTGTSGDDEINGFGGDDWIQALQGDDTIDGSFGRDAIWASLGADTMTGGQQSDTYHISTLGDRITEVAGVNEGDQDRVNSYISLSLLTDAPVTGQDIENMRLVGFAVIDGEGNAKDNWIEGNNQVNSIGGGDGNDTLDGWEGVDTLSGEIGNDIFILDDVSDMADTVDGGVGSNTVNVGFNTNLLTLVGGTATALSWTNIQNITLLGTTTLQATGDNNVNTLVGNVAANKLFGLNGDDVINGAGGADSMVGGIGNDTYVVDNAGDKVIDLAGQGTDSVNSEVTYVLPTSGTSSEVENLFLIKTAAINGTGNALNNIISGNTAANILKGLAGTDTLSGSDGADTLDGGLGNDTHTGGLGDDVYIIDSVLDLLTEAALEGNDKINATFFANSVYTVPDEVERLTLLGTNGNQTITGNASNNWFVGNTQRNVLLGLDGNDTIDGGGGADTMNGGLGNDTFIVDNTFDFIIEGVGEGKDLVKTNASFSMLANASNADDLTLVALTATVGTGNNLSNTITGNAAKNTLSGMDGDDTILGGVGDDIISGGDGNDTSLDGQAGKDTMSGGLGDDVFKVDNVGDLVLENLGEGVDTVVSFINYILPSNVDNLVLQSGLIGGGNNLNNAISGNGGNNTLDGGTGVDNLVGDVGDDTFYVDNAADVVVELVDEGDHDLVFSTVSYTLAAGQEIESLTLLGGIIGTGNEFNNTLTGNAALNTLIGGMGGDTFIVDNTVDLLVEGAGEGFDTVASGVSFDLGAAYLAGQELEGLQLIGNNAINGFGNALDNRLAGNVANNVLTGRLGNDTYVVSGGADIFVELAGEGIDQVESSITYTLAPATPTYQIEGLVLSGFLNINGTGNNLDNFVVGNDASNTLWGGTGNDTLTGNEGNDTFIVDDALLDLVFEAVGEGTDTVMSSATYDLSVHTSNVENLTLTGATAIDGTGTNLVNVIIGNIGVNTLSGLDGNDTLDGNAGADTLVGGDGNDIYYADNIADRIVEAAGEGIDIVYTGFDFNMNFVPNTDEVEKIFATGSNDINITGNNAGQTITGNDGDNILNGAGGDDVLIGGEGNNTLIGGAGNDTFVLDNLSGLTLIDAAEPGSSDTVLTAITFTLAEPVPSLELENITLSGNAVIHAFGNSQNNILIGNAANNTLFGGAGVDQMDGKGGNDIAFVDNAGDLFTEDPLTGGSGIDTVISSVSFDFNISGLYAENLTLTGSANLNGTGNSFNNTITGNTGNNALAGGAGADTYIIQNAGDTVTEVASIPDEFDLIISSVTHTLETDVENMTLTGSLNINGTGNTMDNVILGNLGVNILQGDDGDDVLGADTNDILDGGNGSDTGQTAFTTDLLALTTSGRWTDIENIKLTGTSIIHAFGDAGVNTITGNSAGNTINGRLGDDTYVGRGGNDVYIVDDDGVYIDEVHEGGGKDLVRTSVTFTLDINVDDLTLMGTSNINGFGNASANTITGNSGNNIIDGSLGADVLVGGLGNDTYGVDSGGDKLTDTGGVDTVVSTISFILGTGFENLTLSGVGLINGTGNSGNNIIIGNGNKNTIDGGIGVDTMAGGGESDTYIIDRLSDVINENPGEGDHDLILSKLTYSLAAIANVEDLTLTGTSAINGTGNNLDNIIRGNTGSNVLMGGDGNDSLAGGEGKDYLYGGNGADVFIFEGEGAFKAVDVIKDFDYVNDVIDYSGVLIGLDPLYNVFEDYIESRFVGSDEYIYVDRDGFQNDGFALRLMAIIDNP